MKIKEKIEITKTGKEIIITSPNIEDAKDLAEHANKVFSETKFLLSGIEDGIKKEEDEIRWIDDVNNSLRSFILVAKFNNKIVGVGNVSQKSSKFRTIHRCGLGISIQKEFCGYGIGNILMSLMINNAKLLNYEQIELSVAEKNFIAQNLYKKFGFIEYGKLKNALKYEDNTYDNLIYMVKNLKG